MSEVEPYKEQSFNGLFRVRFSMLLCNDQSWFPLRIPTSLVFLMFSAIRSMNIMKDETDGSDRAILISIAVLSNNVAPFGRLVLL